MRKTVLNSWKWTAAIAATALLAACGGTAEGPAPTVEETEAALVETARGIHERLLPLMQVNSIESNPIPVKAALEAMGFGTARYRLPLVPPSPASRKRTVTVLAALGLRGQALHTARRADRR